MPCFSRLLSLALLVFALAGTSPGVAADMIIENVDLIDVRNERVLRSATVSITDGHISNVSKAPVEDKAGATVIDGSGYVALPGFVDAHTHLWQHAVRGLETASSLQGWSPLVHQFLHYAEEREVYDVTLAAAAQALLSGVTSVSDFASPYASFMLDATSSAIKKAGLGGIIMFWNPAALLPPKVKRVELQRLAAKIAPLRLWTAHGHAFLFAPPVIREGILLADDLGLGLSEHTLETVQGNAAVHRIYQSYLEAYRQMLSVEDRDAIERLVAKGPPSSVNNVRHMLRLARQIMSDKATVAKLSADDLALVETWSRLPETLTAADTLDFLGAFDLANPYVAIHGIWSSPGNLATFLKKNVRVTHNPESNMRLSSGIAPIWAYAKAGIQVAIGTDGAASNDSISMLRAMRAAWNLQKLALLDGRLTGTEIDAWYILRAATIEGARALNIDDQTGSIDVGKEADIILLSKNRLGLSPLIDVASIDNLVPMIIYSADLRNVDTVISDGRIVVRDGELLPPLNELQLSAKLTMVANEVMQRQADGKDWVESLNLDSLATGSPWFQYRSVREKDKIDINIANSGSPARTVTLIMSGTPEGGATAPMLSRKTLSRFPLARPSAYWEREVRLERGESIHIRKAKNSFTYHIEIEEVVVRRLGQDEQLLLLVQ